ncbi:MAG TPA: GyrI-like domain-containing protein [Spirochaetia bacterium]|nr:GyrI-like domain-containing protein [Spirochaetales bacterium]HRW24881.1 GyrI-like domain-containing protein [Spirochaetia bacterium]
MRIIECAERDALSVRYRTPAAKLPETMGPVYGEIAAFMGKNGVPFAGPPFAMYYNMDMDDLDVEVGFPVAAPVAGGGRVRPGKLPGGRHATASHKGSYETIAKTYDALTAFCKERGLELEERMYEEYMNSPEEVPPEELETVIHFLVK